MRTRAPGSRWILRPWQDLVLFVGTPVLILPAVMAAERLWAGKTLYALVMALGALGHHLPGMMRAYGDRTLFRRFRRRFLLAPVFFVALCAGFALWDAAANPILLITYFWGVWHGLMQTHGFLRIYDAKSDAHRLQTARLDQWMCMAWYAGGVVWSASRVHHILQKFYAMGGPAVPEPWIAAVRAGVGALVVTVTLAYVVHIGREWRAGRPANPVKFLLLGTSVAFWWYANAVVQDLLVGIVLSEIFHDVQYLAIVWVYNRRRVDSGAVGGGFTRFLFRSRAGLAPLYVGLVFAYGALSLLPPVRWSTWNAVFGGVLAASTLLHFYYDSFIWKVHEKPTREALGLAGGAEPGTAGRGRRRWAWSGLRWAALGIPLALLAMLHTRPALTRDEAMQALGRAFPTYPLAQNNLAVFLLSNGRPQEAVQVSREVLRRAPRDRDTAAKARYNLFWGLLGSAQACVRAGGETQAAALLHEAAGLDATLVDQLAELAAGDARRGDARSAIERYRMALLVRPQDETLQSGLTRVLQRQNQAPRS